MKTIMLAFATVVALTTVADAQGSYRRSYGSDRDYGYGGYSGGYQGGYGYDEDYGYRRARPRYNYDYAPTYGTPQYRYGY
jgi:hypothetical protein